MTLAEYYELLDEAPYEIIDGELIAMTPQALSSNDIAHVLYDSLKPYVTEHRLGRIRLEAAFALDVEPSQNWVRGSLVPDLAFISSANVQEQKARHADKNVYRVLPDLAVEVVSPTDSFSDVVRKVARYLGYGVPLVWVIDPQNRSVWVHTPEQPEGHKIDEDGVLNGEPSLVGWSMPLSELFAAPED